MGAQRAAHPGHPAQRDAGRGLGPPAAPRAQPGGYHHLQRLGHGRQRQDQGDDQQTGQAHNTQRRDGHRPSRGVLPQPGGRAGSQVQRAERGRARVQGGPARRGRAPHHGAVREPGRRREAVRHGPVPAGAVQPQGGGPGAGPAQLAGVGALPALVARLRPAVEQPGRRPRRPRRQRHDLRGLLGPRPRLLGRRRGQAHRHRPCLCRRDRKSAHDAPSLASASGSPSCGTRRKKSCSKWRESTADGGCRWT